MNSSKKNQSNNSSKTKLNKHKGIVRSEKRDEPKLMRTSSGGKSERRRADTMDDPEISRSFYLHGKDYISKDEALQSLKYLQLTVLNANDYKQFSNLWPNVQAIDETQFRELYADCLARRMVESYEGDFELMAGGKETITAESMKAVMKGTNWKGDIDNIFRELGREGAIDFQEFNHMMRVLNTQT